VYNTTVSTSATSPSPSSRRRLQWLLGLTALDGSLALAWMLRIPAGEALSATRLALLGLLLAGTALPLAALHPAATVRLLSRWDAWQAETPRSRRRIFWLLLTAFNGAYLAALPADLTDATARAVISRIAPLALYLALSSAQCAGLLLLRQQNALQALWRRPEARYTLAVFGALMAAWGIVARTRWGLIPLSEYWYEMGVPVLETHLLLAWSLTAAGRKGAEMLARRGRRFSPRTVDFALGLALYLLAALLWQQAPQRPTWFFTRPYPPNYQAYPASDALRYDSTAQNALIGEGLQTENQARTLRPLYTGLLAVLHAAVGPGYAETARAQALILALFAVLAYRLGCALHSRTAGVLLALLLALQGYTNIAYANLFTISHARLLMPDLPMAVLMAVFLLLTVRWQQTDVPRGHKALYSGAALGALLLVRPESTTAGAAALAAAFLQWKRQPRLWARQAAWFALGAALVTIPWVGRNWVRYGRPFFDSPEPRVYEIIRRALEAPQREPPLPEASPPPTAAPQGQAVPEGRRGLSAPPLPRPQNLLAASVQHYLNSEVQSFLALPATFRLPDTLVSFSYLYARDVRRYLQHRQEPDSRRDLQRRLQRENTLFWEQCCQVRGYLRRLPWWPYWGGLPRQAALPLAFNLLMVALGIGLAFRRWRWAGALPILVHAAYLGGNAVFQISGGRYIQPVNWVVMLYYAAGLAALTLGAGRALGWLGNPILREGGAPQEGDALLRRRAAFAAGIALLLGLALPVGERLAPRRYPPEAQRRMEQAVLAALSPEQQARLQGMLVVSGRALYPRFLEAAVGEPDEHPLVSLQPYPRLTFFLSGAYSVAVRLPLTGLRSIFPHGDDVLAAGCLRSEDDRSLLDALLVARVNPDGTLHTVLWRAAEVPLDCPP